MASSIDDLWDYRDPAVGEARFRDLLPSVGGAARAELLTQIARAQGLQGRFDDGHRTLDEVEELLVAEPEPTRALVRCRLERGRLHNSAGAPDRAVPYFREAWEEAVRQGEDALAVDAIHMLGIAAPSAERLDWNLAALELALGSVDPGAQRWVGALLNNIGWSHFEVGAYDRALDAFEQALDWRKERGQSVETRIAKWAVAKAYRHLFRVGEAVKIQQELKAELDAVGEVDPYVDEELGECLLAMGRRAEALPYLRAAYEALSGDAWLVAHEGARIARLAALARGETGGQGVEQAAEA